MTIPLQSQFLWIWRYLMRPLWRALVRFLDHDGPMLGASIAFSILLAIFPFVLFLVALSGVLGQDTAVRDFIGYAFEYLPVEVGRTIYPVIANIMFSPPKGGIMTFSMIGTLWVASSGVESLRTALDRAYGVESRRPFWWRRLQGLGFVVGGALGILIVMLLIVAGPLVWSAFAALVPVPETLEATYNSARYLAGGLALAFVIWGLYRLLPNVKQHWFNPIPGTLFATISWLLAATLYSMYLQNIANYTVTYGSLGGVIGAMMFFSFTAMIFIFGAELNAALMEQSRDDSVPDQDGSDGIAGQIDTGEIPRRVTARVILFDSADNVLLFRHHDGNCHDPRRPEIVDFWVTPGGDVEPDEVLSDAALRG
ncbi:MAG: YihY family inner membrane protein, partial [Rhodospirillaceae bacterium]|nr:YihY family inner membrane protein [Rhodospirillaceae bacterium]